MMDHRSFLKSLPPEIIKDLTARENLQGLKYLACHITLIVLFGLGSLFAGGWSPLFILFLGISLTFLFTLEHETTHKTPFANELLNEWIGRACAVVLILPFEWFRYFHLAHHKYTNIPGKDPELENPKPETLGQFLYSVSGLPYWRFVVRQIFLNATGRAKAPYIPSRAARRIVIEARIMLVIYALILLSLTVSSIALWLWILPMILGQPFLRLYLMAEHGGCAFVPDMFSNTRTIFTNRIIRFMAWNMPYHAEHHAQPNVPFHKLPDFHRLTKDHLKETSNGYAQFSWAKFLAVLNRQV